MENLMTGSDLKEIAVFAKISCSQGTTHRFIWEYKDYIQLIYQYKGEQEIMINGLSFHINEGELFIILPNENAEYIVSEKNNSLFFYIAFQISDDFLKMEPAEIAFLRNGFINLFIKQSKGTKPMLQNLSKAYTYCKSRHLYKDSLIRSYLTMFFIELSLKSTYYGIKGRDWNKYHAGAFQIYVRSGNSAVCIVPRLDFFDSGSHLRSAFSKNILLADENNNIYRSITKNDGVRIPANFDGFIIVPINGLAVRDCDDADILKNMICITFYFYDQDAVSPLSGGKIFYLGAMSLINYAINDQKISKETVKLLSYSSQDRNADDRLLQTWHLNSFFNKKYLPEQDMDVTFENGLIKFKQNKKGQSLICTVMGCKHIDAEYPDDITHVIDYIKNNLNDKIEISALAQAAYLSESRLKIKFKECVGITPMQYVMNLKVDEANRLLKGKKSITDIAFDLGFSSSSYFSKAYKKVTGLSPNGYRKKFSKG